ncbi:MAG: VIT1/CCC1 transporter family protein [Dehalococcoidia bacterium]|nr:VIT1/CCC1 transporter family protein [Dehalococcoidia bacterium]
MTDVSPRASAADVARYRANLQDEVDGAALYRLLAEAEQEPGLRDIYLKIAESEDRHQALWERKLREAGAEVPAFAPSRRVRFLGWLARRFGTGAVTPIVARMEVDATAMYDNQPEAVAEGLPAEERSHAVLFQEMGRARTPSPGGIARLEGRHRGASGNALRAAVLGVNDGLVSNLSLVMGVAGADPGQDVVVLAGIAGLLAGAFSMALGEWISVRSSAESFERQMSIEREELELMPEEEEAELALIYQAKGFRREEAEVLAKRIVSNKDTALDTLVREELGMTAEEAGNAWVAAITSFVLFTLGAIVPVVPWLIGGGLGAVIASGVAAGAALFLAGAVTSFFTGRGVLYSGGRMLVFGLAAALLTFGIGKLIGVNTGG